MVDLGTCFHRSEPANTVVTRAQAAERQGYDEFWVIEDCFFTSAIPLATAALISTERINVGIGILPVVARNAAVTAMELATLADLAPGRLHAGMGHGVQEWMAQMGARVASPLTALTETFDAVGSLLRGNTVSVEGRYVSLEQVALEPAPAIVPLLSAGVRGPKSLAAAGRCADGVILADFVGADYVRWVREQIANPETAPAASKHRITVFATMGVAPAEYLGDVRAGVGQHLAQVAADAPASLRRASFWPELSASAADIGWPAAIAAMPDDWWTQIAAVGTPDQAATYIHGLADAGADAVALFPSPFEPLDDAAYAATELLPLLGSA